MFTRNNGPARTRRAEMEMSVENKNEGETMQDASRTGDSRHQIWPAARNAPLLSPRFASFSPLLAARPRWGPSAARGSTGAALLSKDRRNGRMHGHTRRPRPTPSGVGGSSRGGSRHALHKADSVKLHRPAQHSASACISQYALVLAPSHAASVSGRGGRSD